MTENQNQSEEKKHTFTQKHGKRFALFSLLVCSLLLLPAIIADFQASKILKVIRKNTNYSTFHWMPKSHLRRDIPLIVRGRGKKNIYLRTTLFQARTKKTQRLVMLFHPHGWNQSFFAPMIDPFLLEGIDVITFDIRGHGESNGRKNVFEIQDSQHDIWHIHRALTDLLGEDGRYIKSVAIGFGKGGDLAIMSSLKHFSVQGVIAVDPWLDFKQRIQTQFSAYPAFIQNLIQNRLERVGGFSFKYDTVLPNANRLKNKAMLLINTKEKNALFEKFCKKKQGTCNVLLWRKKGLNSTKESSWFRFNHSRFGEKIKQFIFTQLDIHPTKKQPTKKQPAKKQPAKKTTMPLQKKAQVIKQQIFLPSKKDRLVLPKTKRIFPLLKKLKKKKQNR